MIIRHFPFFAVAAEEGNLQRAAARLGMTQPALSRRIHDLENELGVPLFDRSSGRLKLTSMGEVLAREASRIVGEVSAVERRLRSKSGVRARLSIGLNERAIGNPAISGVIRGFRSDNPAIELSVSIMTSTQQAAALKEGQLDVAMLYLEPGQGQFEVRPIREDDPFIVVIADDHRLSAHEVVRLADLEGERLIWPSSERTAFVFRELHRVWKSHGLEPRITTQVYTGEAALHAVLAGLGVAVVRRSVTDRAPAGVVGRPLAELADVPLAMSVAWLPQFDAAPRRMFLNLLAERGLIEL